MNLLWIPLLPLLGVMVPPLTERFGRSACAAFSALLPGLALALVLSLTPAVYSGQVISSLYSWVPTLGLNLSFRLDGLSLLFSLLILGIGLLIILYARYYLSAQEAFGRFYAYLILFMTAMLGVVLSSNLLQMWMFWELTSISSFLLIGFSSHKTEARKGARMALAITGAGGLALLAGVLLIAQVVGSYELADVLASGDLLRNSALYLPILLLVLFGAFTKSAQFPFHFWLPHAMSAPTPVSAYLHSATMVKAGIFLLARFYPVLADTDLWFAIVTLTGLVTLLSGAYIALFKHDLKGLLAYSTISHLGLIVLLLGLNTELAAIAAIFHIINHAVFKASLFMAAGIIDHETGTRDMRRINGLWKYMPQTATLAMIAAAAMAGVPLLNGFLSKEMFFAETLQQSVLGSLSWLIPVLATVGGALSVAYSLRFVHDVFFNGQPRDLPKTPHEPPMFMRVPVEVLVVICLLVGLLPALTVSDILESASLAVLQRPLPEFSLAIWHGINGPLAMSVLAVSCGALLYANRRVLFQFQAQFDEVDAKIVFDNAVQWFINRARTITEALENGSLQRYSVLLVGSALLLSGTPLVLQDVFGVQSQQLPMNTVTLAGAVLLAAGSLATVLYSHKRIVALMMLGLVGLIVSIAFAWFSAPDLALTQLVVEVVTVILLLLALFFLPQTTSLMRCPPSKIARDITLSALFGSVVATMLYAILTLDKETISGYFLANAKSGGGGTNVVNVILVDFRGFDTLGEVAVLGIAALGIYKLIAGMKLFMPSADMERRPWVKDTHPLMLKVVAQTLLPLSLLIAVYIFLRGHNLPGGGFIAGLVTAVALLLQYFAHGVDWMARRNRIHYPYLIGSGLLIALATGIGSWAFDKAFLTSWFDYFSWPLVGKFELASAMLFDLGVYLAVIGAVMMILAYLGKLTTNNRLVKGDN